MCDVCAFAQEIVCYYPVHLVTVESMNISAVSNVRLDFRAKLPIASNNKFIVEYFLDSVRFRASVKCVPHKPFARNLFRLFGATAAA